MEHILTPKVNNVLLVEKSNAEVFRTGTLYITTTHLIYVSTPSQESKTSPPDSKQEQQQPLKYELWILHMLICEVEKPVCCVIGERGSHGYMLLKVSCHHFLSASFGISSELDAHNVYLTLMALSRPKIHTDLYAFSYNPKRSWLDDVSSDESNKNEGAMRRDIGWNFHDISAEFNRQEVSKELWTQCTLNSNYELCATYPSVILVPTSASPEIIRGSARFRSKGRLPVLTYYDKRGGSSLIRCSQPLVGIGNGRSDADETYLQCISQSSPNNGLLMVVDTRPPINAMANKASGKGYENEKYYTNINFTFKSIENIHRMRNSLKSMLAACSNSMKCGSVENFLIDLNASGWLRHIKSVLETAFFVCQCMIERKQSVVVHCSDGWDRTAQVCSLSQIMLDPYFRTVTGLQALIEKDWLAFGHKFQDRCQQLHNVSNSSSSSVLTGDPSASNNCPSYNDFTTSSDSSSQLRDSQLRDVENGASNSSSDQVSPIFTQFLDGLYQLIIQFPSAFQYNEKFLIMLHEQCHACQFGTFLGNSEKHRTDLRIQHKTYSLWGHLIADQDEYSKYMNPLYEENPNPIRPCLVPQNIEFWTSLYCRFDEGVLPRQSILDQMQITQAQLKTIEENNSDLSKKIKHLKHIVSNSSTTEAVTNGLKSSSSTLFNVARKSLNVMSNSTASVVDQSKKSIKSRIKAAGTNGTSNSSVNHPLEPSMDMSSLVKQRE